MVKIWSYSISVWLFLSCCVALAQEHMSAGMIQYNQVGYLPKGHKIALVEGNESVVFSIKRADNDQIVFTDQSGRSKYHESAGSNYVTLDFSKLQKEGRFYIDIPNVGKSDLFTISNSCYTKVLQASTKAYYYWRSSAPIDKQYGGQWHRMAGHADTMVYIHPSAITTQRPLGTTINSSGGWYDAGDYNKYVVNSGISTYTLMAAYESYPTLFRSLKWNIPESSDNIPDILNEVFYNLEWLSSMQDPFDGGVYHKLTSAGFAGEVMPHQDRNKKRFIVQKSTAATLNFAAVMAMASRVLQPYYPEYAALYLQNAEQAWRWANSNPKVFYQQEKMNKQYDPDITTGAYDNKDVSDEFAWAACELFLSSRKEKYLSASLNYYKHAKYVGVPSWRNTAMLGIYSLTRNGRQLLNNQQFNVVKNHLLKEADRLSEAYYHSTNKIAFGNRNEDYKWGSNAIAANQGMLLIHAWKLTGKQVYFDAGLSNVDYLLGRNTVAYTYVTGFGDRNPMFPHHRISKADGVEDPIPGLLVGGASLSKSIDKFNLPKYPAKRYIDEYSCYVTNEVAINWNAPLVYLLGAFVAFPENF
ncbi:cellulase [Puteibacter caeruleilacunae]|nr:cellulase [Puteibacter caeruleilacunae]